MSETTTLEATQDDATTDTPVADEQQSFDAEYVAKLRKEAADYRTKAKANADAAKRLAELEEANKTEAQKIAERAETAEKERDTIASELSTLRREQAIYRNAGQADPAALLDSRAFLDSIADLDPTDDKTIAAAIKDAVKANPRLARPGQSAGDLHEGQQRQADLKPNAPGVHRMAAAFEAQLGTP